LHWTPANIRQIIGFARRMISMLASLATSDAVPASRCYRGCAETDGLIERGMLQKLKDWARALKRDVTALWLAARDPRTPWYAKVLAAIVAAYALSPIDLIPDFIPVIGYLDDLLIVPLGILAVAALVPRPLMAEFRAEAARRDRPTSYAGLAIVGTIWLVAGLLLASRLCPGRQ
jgi:uncharacterized membrane protein YkvA (DUF1232 family)